MYPTTVQIGEVTVTLSMPLDAAILTVELFLNLHWIAGECGR